MKVKKEKTILVPVESWWYLYNKSHEQRSETGRPLSEKTKENLIRRAFNYGEWEYHKLCNGDLGGCIGDPLHAWEEGRWTSWSIDEMKQMLDEVDLPYKDGKEIERIEVSM